jgi:hypothetical protein
LNPWRHASEALVPSARRAVSVLHVAGSYRRSFDDHDETFELDGMVEHVVKIGDYTVGRVVQPPGFSWSKNIRPIVGGDWCAARHVGVVVSGRMVVELRDGARFEL